MKKLTTEEFIEKYIKRFGEKYNFEKSVYVNGKTKIIVGCPIHGDFEIRPIDLLNGYGCPYCGGTKKSTTEEFIEKAKYVHGEFFTYDNCVYINSNSKVIVTCPIHGDFEVKANNHLNGCNCPKCSKEGIKHTINYIAKINASTKHSNTEEFIEKARKKYGNKYEYNNVEYIKSCQKVAITCPKHGDFMVTPNHFLSGRGCPLCGKNKKKTTETFIKELKERQPLSDYDYSKVVYKNIHSPVILKCNKCGFEFTNEPSNLLKYNQGCPKCNESHLEKDVCAFLAQKGVIFEQYKKFEWLGKQSVDFYIPQSNIAIECQGIQHFQPVEHFGGIEAYRLQRKNDLKKKELCEQHNIHIIYFADKTYDNESNILTSLEELFNKI